MSLITALASNLRNIGPSKMTVRIYPNNSIFYQLRITSLISSSWLSSRHSIPRLILPHPFHSTFTTLLFPRRSGISPSAFRPPCVHIARRIHHCVPSNREYSCSIQRSLRGNQASRWWFCLDSSCAGLSRRRYLQCGRRDRGCGDYWELDLFGDG